MTRLSAGSKLPKTSSSGHSFDWYLVMGATVALGVFSTLLIIILAFSAWFGWSQWKTFSTAAGLNFGQIQTILQQSSQITATQTNGHKNILLLGVDSLAGRGDVPPLTDTMMLLSLDLGTGTIATTTLPRDIWLNEYQTKINSLYAYGRQQNPANPTELPETALEQITGIPIHHTLIVTLDQVAQVIDLMGGVEVDVQTGFVDEQFPRPNVDVTVERDPAKLYQRVEFQTGVQTLSGERALQYIRSRHSQGDEGDDVARARRQQQVVAALMARLQHPEQWISAQKAGQLVALYQTNWANSVSFPELIATFKALDPATTSLALKSQALPLYPADPQGVIWHPPVSAAQQNQWVYLVRDPQTFKSTIQAILGIKP